MADTTEAQLTRLANLLADKQPVLALTGAGISTQSGIPAYRDATGKWVQSQPVKAAEFKNHESVRKRYWSRSMQGWPTFQSASPNAAHRAMATLQQAGIISTIITQNVDGLHQAAGSADVIDLHGALSRVICLNCSHSLSRHELQQRLVATNPQFVEQQFVMGPDGDASPVDSRLSVSDFQLVHCDQCGGVLKPDVVFFGENVPTARVEACMQALDQAQSLLCVGTSLSVLSGFRFCLAAHKQDKPICLLNQGKTRADAIATIKVEVECGSGLSELVTLLR